MFVVASVSFRLLYVMIILGSTVRAPVTLESHSNDPPLVPLLLGSVVRPTPSGSRIPTHPPRSRS